MTEIKKFTFTIVLAGEGEHPEEAWEDARASFFHDPPVEPTHWHEEINISED